VAGAPREGDEQRRRRRGGRDRHRGERRPDQAGGQMPQGLPVAEQEAETSVPAYLAKAPDANELRARERAMHLAAMREEEARQREEAPAREQPREEPVRQEAVRPEPAPTPVPVRVDPKVILENAGLQMVETNPHKVQPPVSEPEPLQLGRPRREKPRPAGEEPLVQVETKQ